jgi:hypothetical protein
MVNPFVGLISCSLIFWSFPLSRASVPTFKSRQDFSTFRANRTRDRGGSGAARSIGLGGISGWGWPGRPTGNAHCWFSEKIDKKWGSPKQQVKTLPTTNAKKESHLAQTMAARPEIVELVAERWQYNPLGSPPRGDNDFPLPTPLTQGPAAAGLPALYYWGGISPPTAPSIR